MLTLNPSSLLRENKAIKLPFESHIRNVSIFSQVGGMRPEACKTSTTPTVDEVGLRYFKVSTCSSIPCKRKVYSSIILSIFHFSIALEYPAIPPTLSTPTIAKTPSISIIDRPSRFVCRVTTSAFLARVPRCTRRSKSAAY